MLYFRSINYCIILNIPSDAIFIEYRQKITSGLSTNSGLNKDIRTHAKLLRTPSTKPAAK